MTTKMLISCQDIIDAQGSPEKLAALKGGVVCGGLDLRGTQVVALPEGLEVGGELYLRDGAYYPSVEAARSAIAAAEGREAEK